MAIKLPTHLYRNRHGTFYFRLVIPHELRPVAMQREIRFSLRTEQRGEAIIAAIPIIAGIPGLIADLRSMAANNTTVSPQYFGLWLEEKRKNINLQARNDALEDELIEARRQLEKSVARDQAQQVVKAAYDKGQLRGRKELELRLAFPWPPETTVPFSKLMVAYLKSLTVRAEGGRKTPPTAKTLEEYERTLGFFITVMGDIKIGEIDRAIAGAYFSTLKLLPANLSRVAKYRGKSISEVLAMNATPQTETNCSKKVERISTMFKWALEEKRTWGIDANPFTGYGQAENTDRVRRPFTHDELRALLNHPQFVEKRFASNYAFWLIPLAIYTGARLGELAQLDLKDFIEVEGIPCIDINDTDASEIKEEGSGRKRIKTKNAKRLVPIHPELIRIGILRHVERLRYADKSPHLFPELSRKRRDGPAQAAGNWFARLRERVGITAKQETVFHSFRHLFITTILDANVSPHMLAPVVGHEAELITGKVYWEKKDATKRKPTVDAFALPNDILEMFPVIEEATFIAPRGPRPGRKHTQASENA